MVTNHNAANQISSCNLNKALDSLGEDPKRKIVHYLHAYYGISLEKPIIHSTDLERALYSMMGSGAEIIIQITQRAEMISELR